eukprot:TRINITY_DN3685_c0_g1_i1.p1 TRINITY_DN3685_c0_g1~~TRINITY_DN3685_c0_g1_i1.p1  ORF type:complete len:492 (-),score=107.27 TRINITY_DN3685_c0_g1_i1:882-2279(-)
METEIYTHLQATKGRGEDIRNRIGDLLANFERNRNLTWPEVLEQFEVLSEQYSALSTELNQEVNQMLHHYVVQPVSINPAEPNQISELLRTKTLPEIEAEEQKMLQLYEASVVGQNAEERVSVINERTESFNSMVEEVENMYDELKQKLNLKSKREPFETDTNQVAFRSLLRAINDGIGLRPSQAAPPMQAQQLPVNIPTKAVQQSPNAAAVALSQQVRTQMQVPPANMMSTIDASKLSTFKPGMTAYQQQNMQQQGTLLPQSMQQVQSAQLTAAQQQQIAQQNARINALNVQQQLQNQAAIKGMQQNLANQQTAATQQKIFQNQQPSYNQMAQGRPAVAVNPGVQQPINISGLANRPPTQMNPSQPYNVGNVQTINMTQMNQPMQNQYMMQNPSGQLTPQQINMINSNNVKAMLLQQQQQQQLQQQRQQEITASERSWSVAVASAAEVAAAVVVARALPLRCWS